MKTDFIFPTFSYRAGEENRSMPSAMITKPSNRVTILPANRRILYGRFFKQAQCRAIVAMAMKELIRIRLKLRGFPPP
jgi:hypothetical protein